MQETITKPPMNNPGLSYGLTAGLITILILFGQYLGGVQVFLSPIGFISHAVVIVFAVLAGLRRRKDQGFLEFGEALKITFMVFAVALAIQTVFTYILFNVIDPGFRDAVMQESMIKMEQTMQKFGMSASDIDKMTEKQLSNNPYSISNVLLGYAVTCIVFFLISLIISAIIKRSRPPFEDSFTN